MMITRRSLLKTGALAATSAMATSCLPRATEKPPIVLGYSTWAGWWPWAIAEEEKLFAANGVNVQMRWFDGYLESIKAFGAGQIDGNSQTLNDTVSMMADAVSPPQVVLVNDNSAGNDQLIVRSGINTIKDLLGKKVAVEEGVVGDFLLSLALDKAGYSRKDVTIVPLETGAAATAFLAGQVDAAGLWAPFWLRALERPGSKALYTSKEFPGAIPDLLVVSQKLTEERPEDVQKIIKTWFDVREFMEKNPQRANEIMAKRAEVTLEELQLFADGVKFFTPQDNLKAFQPGEGMVHMPYAAKQMANFMVSVGFIPSVPDMSGLFNKQFIQAYLEEKKVAYGSV
ncbi:MAG: ABC transporter substrate-binding protein [Gloeomargarita sp. HHBFW_bins_162]